jgi:hypothetical protein
MHTLLPILTERHILPVLAVAIFVWFSFSSNTEHSRAKTRAGTVSNAIGVSGLRIGAGHHDPRLVSSRRCRGIFTLWFDFFFQHVVDEDLVALLNIMRTSFTPVVTTRVRK